MDVRFRDENSGLATRDCIRFDKREGERIRPDFPELSPGGDARKADARSRCCHDLDVSRRSQHEVLDLVRQIRMKPDRSEEHTSELQSLMRISYAVFCLKKKKHQRDTLIRISTNTRL